MQEARAALRGQAIGIQKRWLCVAVALLSLLLLPSLPFGRESYTELVTTEDVAKTQPVPAAFVTVDEDDDGMPTSTSGTVPTVFAPLEASKLDWIAPDMARPFCARLDPAPTVRAPPFDERC